MNLFLYASDIALSFAFLSSFSAVPILNFMQFSVKPSLEIMPCLIAFLFSDFVFHKSQ